MVGAGHIAQPMAHLGALLGFKVTVLDDRPDFATRERFPDAERLVAADFSNPFADITSSSPTSGIDKSTSLQWISVSEPLVDS